MLRLITVCCSIPLLLIVMTQCNNPSVADNAGAVSNPDTKWDQAMFDSEDYKFN